MTVRNTPFCGRGRDKHTVSGGPFAEASRYHPDSVPFLNRGVGGFLKGLSFLLADCSKVDVLGQRYKLVNFGAEMSRPRQGPVRRPTLGGSGRKSREQEPLGHRFVVVIAINTPFCSRDRDKHTVWRS